MNVNAVSLNQQQNSAQDSCVFYIHQDSKPCDILCPCKKIHLQQMLEKTILKKMPSKIVTEESNYFINCFFCQYRRMKLQIYDKKTKMKYVAERTCIVPWGQMNMKLRSTAQKKSGFKII